MKIEQKSSFKNTASRIVCVIAFVVPALSLTTSWSTSRGLALLGLIGILARVRGWVPVLSVPYIYKPLLWLACITAALATLHQDNWGVYHLPLYIVLAYPGIWAVRLASDKAWRWASWGAMLGATLGASIAISHGGFVGNRENGIFNPIPYGGMALGLAVVSLSSLHIRPARVATWIWSILCMSAAGAGLLTSLLSGSKAGWLSLPLMVISFAWIYRKHLGLRHNPKILLAAVSMMLALGAGLSVSPVGQRITEAIQGVRSYTKQGQVTEGSIGPRLELWRYGLSVLPQSPILGMGKLTMIKDLHEKAELGLYDSTLANLHTLHNEFLNMQVTNGVFALVALLWFYLRFYKYGSRLVGLNDGSGSPTTRSVGAVAVGLCMIYLALGVGEVALGLSDLRNFLLFWLVLILNLESKATTD